MAKSVLIISNDKPFTDIVKERILSIVDNITQSGKEVHIFKEDILLYSLLKDKENIFCINGLSSGADLLLFNKINEDIYFSSDKVKTLKADFSDVYKKSISRHPSPERSKAYDEKEYKTMRESVMIRRLKYSISQIALRYNFIINFKDSKDLNIINNLNPVYGDGKFIYIYDCSKNKSEFAVGGCYLSDNEFNKCIREV